MSVSWVQLLCEKEGWKFHVATIQLIGFSMSNLAEIFPGVILGGESTTQGRDLQDRYVPSGNITDLGLLFKSQN